MSKKNSYNPFQGANFDKFNALKQQLERENAKLLKERTKIQYQTENYPGPASQHTIIEKNQLSIDDEEDQSEENGDLPHFQVGERAFSNPQFKNSRKTVREQIGQKGDLLSDDVMEMIEEIERKALAEIESLRADKITLLKKLNKQIKDHNSEKKRSAQYEKRVMNSNSETKKTKPRPQRRPSQPKTPANIIYQEEQQNSPSPQQDYYQPQQLDRPIQQNPNFQQPEPIQSGRQAYNGRDNFDSNQVIQSPQSIQSQKYPPRLNNQNVIPSQSFYYLDRTPKAHNFQGSNPELQIQSEINRLRQQNAQMRNTISSRGNFYGQNFPIKNQLRNELNQLEAKANRYEQMIRNTRNMQVGSEGLEGSEIETLLLQGATLTQQGQRLMKAKSNPQLRSSIGVNRNEFQNPLQSSQHGGRYNNNNNRFSPGEYESIIANMRRAANS